MKKAAFLLVLLVMIGGCESSPRVERERTVTADGTGAAAVVPTSSELNDGYFLLHELVSKQQRVSTVLILPFKKMSGESRELMKQIARASTDATRQLEEFAKEDSTLRLDAGMLSPIEKATRGEIESIASRRILGAGGDQFELQLLVAQVDATDYGAALAREIAEIEKDPQRQKWLREFAAKYEQFRQQALERLAVK